LAPTDPRARFYIAEYDRQEGRFKDALDAWVAMLGSAPSDAPWVSMVQRRAEELADQMGVDLAELLAAAPDPVPGELSSTRAMSDGDRRAMVAGVVEGLASRLARDPSDFEGWMRLIRSRAALGETDAAQQDLNEAAGHFAAAPVPMRMLGGLAAELGLSMPGEGEAKTGAPRGPTAEDVAAAQAMEEEDRQAMIAGMVDQLAARLEDEPDDLEGWTMLGRSYAVLNRGEDAVAALTRASELAPNNPSLLIDRARIMRSLAGDRQTPETVALMARVAELDPDNTEALWFLGLDKLRAGDRDDARDLMDRAVATIPEAAPERAALERQIQSLFPE
jgi:cytochrome c-type biogenesis protein CcmH